MTLSRSARFLLPDENWAKSIFPCAVAQRVVQNKEH